MHHVRVRVRRCVCLVYDPQRSQRGALALRAIRVREGFVDLFKADRVSAKELREAGVSWKDIFVDVPIKVRAPASSSSPRATAHGDTTTHGCRSPTGHSRAAGRAKWECPP